MVRSALLLLFVFAHFHSIGQDFADSIELEEVKVYGIPLKEYSVGSKIYKIDSASIAQSSQNNISELISRKSPIYFKNYGQGMLSTVSFRGTSSNHTAVLWNGLNINFPTLGQTDFSLLPVFAFQQVDIQPGSASTLYGSGAIGGSIHLYNEPDWKDKLNIGVQQGVSSFSNYFTGLNAEYSKGNLESNTKLYYQTQENNFPFKKSDGETGEQQNAAIKKHGIIQELNYKLSSNRYVSFSGWYSYTDRELQPTITNNLNPGQYTVQTDNSLRLTADYHHNVALGYFNVKAAYLRDFFNYNNVNEYTTQQYISSLGYENNLFENIHFTIGAKLNHTRADVEQYENFEFENRLDIYSAIKFQLTDRWKVSLIGRQNFNEGYETPFVPSLGSELRLLSDSTQQLMVRLLAGKSFRLPTLNERFWVSGDPNIRPEKGNNVEGGFDYSIKKSFWEGKTSVTYYAMWMDDWILWQPGVPEWYPSNVKKVNFSGIEWTADFSIPFSNGSFQSGWSYTYSRAINQTALSEYSRAVGKQLPYSPRHSGVLYADILWKQWSLSSGLTATGKRYIGDDNVDFLEPFSLVNIGLNKKMLLRNQHSLTIGFKINNLLDTQFETYQNRAMPGINYETNIKYNFTIKP